MERKAPRTLIDWSLPQICVTCLNPMKKSGTLAGIDYVVHKQQGWCVGCHYKKQYDERPVGTKNYKTTIVDGMKTCKSCLETLPVISFYPSKNIKDGYDNECRTCDDLRKYHITKKQYHELLAEQDYRCAICRTHIDDLDRKLYVDHDHLCCETKARSCGECIRGLLCMTCNSGIGMLRDDENILQNALNYVKTHRKGLPIGKQSI